MYYRELSQVEGMQQLSTGIHISLNLIAKGVISASFHVAFGRIQ